MLLIRFLFAYMMMCFEQSKLTQRFFRLHQSLETDYFFGKIGELAGLQFEDTHMLRKKRTGSSIQSSVRTDHAQAKTVLYESGIVLRKKS
jgi:hypothetical protein